MKKIIVIGGATASGKTALAIEVAKHFKTEILSADSRQCYQEMTIGTAVPSKDELQEVKHHFIHSHSIHDHFTAGDYERFALQALDNLFQTHDTVVVVGGTGLYLKALCDGIDEMPNLDEKIVKQTELEFELQGLIGIQNSIEKEDPAYFSEGEMQNPTRIIRALSFVRSTQKSILEYRTQTAKKRDFEISKFAIQIEREVLYERINKRVDQMMIAGLGDEAESLFDFRHLKNLQTVGYAELFGCFEGLYSEAFAIDKIKQHTRNYAKRQTTWFKNQSNYTWIKHASDII